MKNSIKQWAEATVPTLVHAYRSITLRRLGRPRYGPLQSRTKEKLYSGNDGNITVLHGPFKGLRYFDEIVWSSITPKWLGSYELELHAAVEEIVSRNYQVIIDVGCAEGYYAAGLAYRIPGAHVFAYDVDFISRRQARKLAALNGLESRVSVFGFCHPSDIEKLTKERTLVVCDIEGFESVLLDPATCPTLKKVDMLVEIHDVEASETLDLIKGRFAATHEIEELTMIDRGPWVESVLAETPGLSREELSEAADELRGYLQKWLWLKAHNPV